MDEMRCNIGIYNLQMKAMGGGEKLTLVLAEHLSSTHNVSLFCAEPLDIPSLEQFFGVDLSRVTVTSLNSVGPLVRVAEKMFGGLALSLHHYRQLKKTNLDIFINNSYASRLRCPASQGIFMCMFPHTAQHLGQNGIRGIRSAFVSWIERRLNESPGKAIDSYLKVVAISQYSADWLRQMWKRGSQIIYPPCDDMGPPATKGNIILNVGRFIAGADFFLRMRNHQEANVVVLVLILDHPACRVVAGGDIVHVDIERHHHAIDRHDVEVREAGFLAGLAERDFFDEPLPVGVSAQLQPAVKFAVVR